MSNLRIEFKSIGIIHSPYKQNAPHQPVEDLKNEYYIELNVEFTDGLKDLDKFIYIYVIFHMDRYPVEKIGLTAFPPWLNDPDGVGLFSSRSPIRPNPIGLSIVKIKSIQKNRIYVSGIDALDGTPVLDIKPYIRDLDLKEDANNGWIIDKKIQKELEFYRNNKQS